MRNRYEKGICYVYRITGEGIAGWLPDSAPAAVLQITHGITEHMGRYESLAQFLRPLGIAVQFRLLNHYRHVVLGEERTGAATIARNLIAEFLGKGAAL